MQNYSHMTIKKEKWTLYLFWTGPGLVHLPWCLWWAWIQVWFAFGGSSRGPGEEGMRLHMHIVVLYSGDPSQGALGSAGERGEVVFHCLASQHFPHAQQARASALQHGREHSTECFYATATSCLQPQHFQPRRSWSVFTNSKLTFTL